MKHKAGDRVRIKKDLSECGYASESMRKFEGEIMTVRDIEKDTSGCFYKMREDVGEHKGNASLGWDWYEDMIEGPAEPTDKEVLRMAIDTYGHDEQIRICQEEMNELGVAFSKYHREPNNRTWRAVQEELADVGIMLRQMAIMFSEEEINRIASEKIDRLKERLEDERKVETVEGRHSVNGKTYTWINPDGATVKIGHVAIAETSKGHMPIIVTHVRDEKTGNVKRHKKIIAGGLNE
ncbi:MAG: hypothetical protein HFE75_05000 [Firmicutes bacterium]|jgi:NTP pyrophosphatase (non-canonical NTP hydrolase)|nr:hypothetical protein [Bacillota bacterium]